MPPGWQQGNSSGGWRGNAGAASGSGWPKGSAGAAGGSKLCRHWTATGQCSFGTKCNFLHGTGSAPGASRGPSAPAPGMCKSFLSTGQCNYGARCRYMHTANGSAPASSNTTGSRTITRSNATDSRRFVLQLSLTPGDRLATIINSAETLWQQCWTDAGPSFDLIYLEKLSIVLAKIPFSAVVPPPPLHAWEDATMSYISKSKQSNKSPGANTRSAHLTATRARDACALTIARLPSHCRSKR